MKDVDIRDLWRGDTLQKNVVLVNNCISERGKSKTFFESSFDSLYENFNFNLIGPMAQILSTMLSQIAATLQSSIKSLLFLFLYDYVSNLVHAVLPGKEHVYAAFRHLAPLPRYRNFNLWYLGNKTRCQKVHTSSNSTPLRAP